MQQKISGREVRKVKIAIVALIVLAVLLFISRMKWKIAMRSLIYFMEQRQYKYPDKKEVEECTAFVLKNMFKDLTRPGHRKK